jgi:hypothetical protein
MLPAAGRIVTMAQLSIGDRQTNPNGSRRWLAKLRWKKESLRPTHRQKLLGLVMVDILRSNKIEIVDILA